MFANKNRKQIYDSEINKYWQSRKKCKMASIHYGNRENHDADPVALALFVHNH